MANINNPSGNGYGHSNFTNLQANVEKGQSYPITLTPGTNTPSATTVYWRVWIDYNGDGDFTDAGELVLTATGNSTTPVSANITIPQSAAIGTTRMRVTMSNISGASSCATGNTRDVEDYTINIQAEQPPCSAPANLESLSIGYAHSNFSWNPVPGAVQYEARLRRLPDGAWNDSNGFGNTSLLYGLNPCVEYEFQVRADCGNGNLSSYSSPLVVQTRGCGDNYCYSYGRSWRNWITGVSVADLNNLSGNGYGHSDFTDVQVNMEKGQSYPITLSPGTNVAATTVFWRVWIDFNGDGDFADAGEQVLSTAGSSVSPTTDSIAIPTTAATGPTRMRVSMSVGEFAESCTIRPSNADLPLDVEDYTINIQPAVQLPVANFTANVTAGTAPLSVQFTDQSTNTPSSWLWNFGNGQTSTQQNPSVTYSSAGTYTVSLTATNSAGANTFTRTAYITVNPAVQQPVANFTANVTSGTAPLSVQFTDQSTNTPSSWLGVSETADLHTTKPERDLPLSGNLHRITHGDQRSRRKYVYPHGIHHRESGRPTTRCQFHRQYYLRYSAAQCAVYRSEYQHAHLVVVEFRKRTDLHTAEPERDLPLSGNLHRIAHGDQRSRREYVYPHGITSPCRRLYPGLPSPTGENHTVIIPATLNATLDGAPLQNGDVIGFFYEHNGSLHCSNFAALTGVNNSVAVYGNDANPPAKNGFATGEPFKVKIYQASTQQEFDAQVTYAPVGTAGIVTHTHQYANDGISMLSGLTASTATVLDIPLQQGWNMISSYVQPADGNMLEVFSPIAAATILVKDNLGATTIPSLNINNIGAWQVVEGYKVRVNANTTLSISGTRVDPSATPIPVAPGWQIISYLREQQAAAPTVLASISGIVEVLKDNAGNSYIPEFGINTIGNLRPTQGYKLKASGSGTLSYPPNFAPDGQGYAVKNLPGAEKSSLRHFVLDSTLNTGNNSLIIFPASAAGAMMEQDDEIGVFTVAGILCGAGVYQGNNFAVTVWGDDTTTPEIVEGMAPGEAYTFRIWKNADDLELPLQVTFAQGSGLYAEDAVDVVQSLQIVSAVENSRHKSLPLSVFPNPASDEFFVRLPEGIQVLEIRDATGRLLQRIVQPGEALYRIDAAGLPKGLAPDQRAGCAGAAVVCEGGAAVRNV
jgi:PKD repeat protein